MKEKTTAILSLGCIFSLFFYYKISSPNHQDIAVDNTISENEVVQQLIEKVENKNVENQISESFLEVESSDEEKSFLDFARGRSKGIKIQGIKNLMVSFGKCCNPIPGDEMIGFITRGRGVTVHRAPCKSLPLLSEESDRLVPVDWDVGRSDIFNVRLKVESIDRKGMLREITEVISSFNINITSVDMKVKDALSTAFFIIQINNIKQLDRIINKVIKIPGVDNIERTGF